MPTLCIATQVAQHGVVLSLCIAIQVAQHGVVLSLCIATQVAQHGVVLSLCIAIQVTQWYIHGVVSSLCMPPDEKQSGERSWISWAYFQNMIRTDEVVRLLIIM